MGAPDKILIPGSTDAGTLLGVVSNRYDTPLQELQITPQIVDPKGRVILTLAPTACSCVPAGGTARYSAKYEGVPEEMIDKVRIAAKVTPMAKGMVCYDVVDVEPVKAMEKVVSVRGRAQNRGANAMNDCYVWVDFYTREWIYLRSVKGSLTDDVGGRLSKGRTVGFKAELVATDSDEAERFKQAVARVVGKEE
jgi:hypothetical protein